MKRALYLIGLFSFSTFLSTSLWAEPYGSKETETFFNSIAKTCQKLDYFDCAKSYRALFLEKLNTRDFYSEEFTTKFEESMNLAQCDQGLIQKYKELLKKDLYPFHVKKLEKLKKEALEFKKKKLSPGHHVVKYEDYKKKYEIEAAPFDEAISSIKKGAEEMAIERQKTCNDVVNLKAPLDLDKPKDQDTIGWCYAYATSDLIAHATGVEPSAAYMAQLVNQKFLWKSVGLKQAGLIQIATKETLQNGICLERDFPSGDYAFSVGKKNYDLNYVFRGLIKFKKEVSGKDIESVEEVKNLLCASDLNDPLKEMFPALSLDQMAQIILSSSYSSVFKKLADSSCPLHSGDPLKQFNVVTVSTMLVPNQPRVNEKKWRIMDEQLNKGNIVGIHYDSKMLYDYHSNRPYFDHVSSIVGRRFNKRTGSCEYLLRNSWGKLCPKSFKDYDCKNGHYWIPEQFFNYNEAIKQIVYLEKK